MDAKGAGRGLEGDGGAVSRQDSYDYVVYVCFHTAMCVSSDCCECVLIPLYRGEKRMEQRMRDKAS